MPLRLAIDGASVLKGSDDDRLAVSLRNQFSHFGRQIVRGFMTFSAPTAKDGSAPGQGSQGVGQAVSFAVGEQRCAAAAKGRFRRMQLARSFRNWPLVLLLEAGHGYVLVAPRPARFRNPHQWDVAATRRATFELP
jgi:hypothetical protein